MVPKSEKRTRYQQGMGRGTGMSIGMYVPAVARVVLPQSGRLVRNRGVGEGRLWVPHSVEYDDLSTPHASSRQRYVSDHSA